MGVRMPIVKTTTPPQISGAVSSAETTNGDATSEPEPAAPAAAAEEEAPAS